MMKQQNLNFIFDFFSFLIVLIKLVELQLETRYFDSVKGILKQMQCIIRLSKKDKNNKWRVLTPCVKLCRHLFNRKSKCLWSLVPCFLSPLHALPPCNTGISRSWAQPLEWVSHPLELHCCYQEQMHWPLTHLPFHPSPVFTHLPFLLISRFHPSLTTILFGSGWVGSASELVFWRVGVLPYQLYIDWIDWFS